MHNFSYLNARYDHIRMKLNITVQNKLTTRMLWALAILTIVFTYVNMSQIAPNDFWWHMAVGRDILTTGEIPAVDIYSYTMAGQPYLSYQMFWLMDLWLYWLFSLGGPELILFVHSLVITGTYIIILIMCWRNSHNWGVTSLCLLFAIVLGVYAWNVRPQAISFLIGSIFLYAIYAYRRRPNPLWLPIFPMGMLIWVNSHGTFPIGLLMLGIWLGDEIWQVYLTRRKGIDKPLGQIYAPGLALLVTSAICIINPRGVGIVSYLITMASNPAVQTTVPEWAPPSFTSPIGPLFFGSILFTAVVLVISSRRPTFFQLTTFFAFASLGLWTTRGVVWFALALAPILADHLSVIMDGLPKKQKRYSPQKKDQVINLAILFLLCALALVSLPWFRGSIPIRPEYKSHITRDTPVEATSFLVDQQPAGRIYNDMAFGSYLIWAAQPHYQVFVDPRIELFTQNVWNDYQLISNAKPGWEVKLEEYDIRTLMLNPAVQGPLAQRIENSDQWRLIYQDSTAQIFSTDF
jgi:hypothetical protein